VSKEDVDAWCEMAYLLRSPTKRQRLVAAQQCADAGQYEERELLEP
jgi:hypothetical protein